MKTRGIKIVKKITGRIKISDLSPNPMDAYAIDKKNLPDNHRLSIWFAKHLNCRQHPEQ